MDDVGTHTAHGVSLENTSKHTAEGTDAIVFFDGVCGLCNRVVDLLVRVDRERRLRYAPLQGKTAAKLLPLGSFDPGAPDTFIFLDKGQVYVRSDAALRLAQYLNRPWSWLRFFRFVPRVVRDTAYRIVARNRYGWFGKLEVCRLPSAEERPLFFD